MISEEKAGGRLTHKRYNWLKPLNVSLCVMIGEDKVGAADRDKGLDYILMVKLVI